MKCAVAPVVHTYQCMLPIVVRQSCLRPPHAAVCLLTLSDTLLRGPLRCRSSAQAPGIGGLGLSKEETRIVHANTMHSHTGANFVPSVSHPFIGLQGAAWLVQLPGTKL